MYPISQTPLPLICWKVGEDTDRPESENLGFGWEVQAHEPKEIQIKFTFENPELLSVTNFGNDSVRCKMKNFLIFKSMENGLSLDADRSLAGARKGQYFVN